MASTEKEAEEKKQREKELEQSKARCPVSENGRDCLELFPF